MKKFRIIQRDYRVRVFLVDAANGNEAQVEAKKLAELNDPDDNQCISDFSDSLIEGCCEVHATPG